MDDLCCIVSCESKLWSKAQCILPMEGVQTLISNKLLDQLEVPRGNEKNFAKSSQELSAILLMSYAVNYNNNIYKFSLYNLF